jgi:hypothetical protein
LNTDLGINNERQDCKIGTVCVSLWRDTCKRGRVSKGDEGGPIWLMDFIYLHEIEQ